MQDNERIYRELQQHLDKGPAGFPSTKSGTDIQLLKHLLTPEEALIATQLSTMKPEPASKIQRRVKGSGLDISLDELKKKLDLMVRKGTILTFSEGRREKLYKNVGVSAGGMIDFQVNRLTHDFIDDLDKYHEETFSRAQKPKIKPVPQLRTIPVAKSVPLPEKLVSTYDDVRKLVEQAPGPFSVANCICRQMKDMRDQKCKYSELRETCLQIGPDHARQYVEMGIGRPITKPEVFTILDKAEAAGFILQPENSKSPQNICCCCGDCCGPLSAAKKSPRPAEMYASNYYVAVDPALCTGCRKCIERCQMDARIFADGKAKVDLDRCIGCGNCVTTCTSGASAIRQKETTFIPFETKDATFEEIMARKLGRWGMFHLRLKAFLGMKV
jgi:Na+-translocating ferredoxin:NAD+ oxidoreductase subunit B